jgi:hypothetical protein
MQKRDPRRLYIDGKAVRAWLVAHVIKNVDGTRSVECVQVEAFGKDHAIKRLREAYPMVESRAWEFLEELDPEHDVGALGRKLPLTPLMLAAPRIAQ